MIEELEQPAVEADEPPIGFVQFDLKQMNYDELVRLRAGDMTQAELDDILQRVVIGGRAAIPVAYIGYALGDLIAEVNERQSPKVRSAGPRLPASDEDESQPAPI